MPRDVSFNAEDGAFENGATLPDDIIGKTVWQANPIIIDLLKAAGALLGQRKIDHSYPHCWRCHNPTIFRATEQWFIGMERNDLRQKTLAAIKNVKWIPAWGEDRMTNMIATRPDWCISRQRVWGVPITVFYCEGCQEPFTNRKVLDRRGGAVPRTHRRRLVRKVGRRADGHRHEVRKMRRRRIPKRERHSWMSGSIPDPAISPS